MGAKPLRRRTWLLVLVLLAASPAAGETVTVFAAASLTDAFRSIGKDFEAAHAGTRVEFNFAGSSTLVRQITEGGPADVFASADEENMQKAAAAGEVAGTARVFVQNRLTIIVAKGNPKHVVGLADLARPGMTIALAAPAVPVGRYAAEAFAKAGMGVPTASNEADVKGIVTRVSLGEADAGVVYTTDVTAGGDRIEALSIPEAHNVLARYPIAILKHAPNEAGARAFVAHVLSPAGRDVLTRAGFVAP